MPIAPSPAGCGPRVIAACTHWEDFVVGDQVPVARWTVTADEVARYAAAFTPSITRRWPGGVPGETSGWHVAMMYMRQMVDAYLGRANGLGSPGLDAVSWSNPVVAGDELAVTMTTLDARALRSRPGVGLVKLRYETVNGRGETVMTWRCVQLFGLRGAPPEDTAAVVDARKPGAAAPTASIASAAGATIALGGHRFTREDIVAFAAAYDPQDFHLDEAAAARGLFGGLSASGWHTVSVWVRLYDDYLARAGDIARFTGTPALRPGGSPGCEAIRWIKPVLVGDMISFTTQEVERHPVPDRPGACVLVADNSGHNQRGDLVFSVRSSTVLDVAQAVASGSCARWP